MTNQSVERFKQLTVDLQKEVHVAAVDELNKQANGLVSLMISAAPHDKGNLAHTVRVVKTSKDTIVRIVAGGSLTTRRSVSGQPFDYARADEFGTVKMAARPFFFPTYRLFRKKIIATMRRRITASIKTRSAE